MARSTDRHRVTDRKVVDESPSANFRPIHRPKLANNAAIELSWIDDRGVTIFAHGEILRLAPLGAEVSVATETLQNLDCTDVIVIRLPDERDASHLNCIVVAIDQIDSSSTRLVCRIVRRAEPSLNLVERRRGVRWNCAEDFQPSGVAPNPMRSSDFIFFRAANWQRRGTIGAMSYAV